MYATFVDDSIMIAIWVNCSDDHKGAEDSLVCALIYNFREILDINQITLFCLLMFSDKTYKYDQQIEFLLKTLHFTFEDA